MSNQADQIDLKQEDEKDDFMDQHTAGRYSQGKVVSLIVGQKSQKFHVHVNLLRQKSEVFRTSLGNQWADTKAGELDLGDENPEVIESMIDWSYHGTLPKLQGPSKLDFDLSILLYQFAEVRMMHDLKNLVMDIIRRDYVQHIHSVEVTELAKVYAIGLRYAQLGKFMVKSVVYEIMQDDLGDHWPKALAEACEEDHIALDILKEIIVYKLRGYDRPCELYGCQFHDHADGGSCNGF